MTRVRFIGAIVGAAILAAALPANAEIEWAPDVVHSRAEFLVSHLIVSKVWGHIPVISLELTTEPSGMPTRVKPILNPAHEDTDKITIAIPTCARRRFSTSRSIPRSRSKAPRSRRPANPPTGSSRLRAPGTSRSRALRSR